MVILKAKEYFTNPLSLGVELLFIIVPIIAFLNFPDLLPYRTLYILLSVLYVFLYFKKTETPIAETLGVNKTNVKKTIMAALALSTLSIGLLLLILKIYPELRNLGNILNELNEVPLYIFLLIYIFLSIPIQEFIFRGYFISRMKLLTNDTKISILYSSTLFAIAHLAFGQLIIVPFAFLFGILLAALFSKFNNILGPIIYHATTGVVAILLVI